VTSLFGRLAIHSMLPAPSSLRAEAISRDAPAPPGNVRNWGQGGKHMLNSRFIGFDPKLTSALLMRI
jgi:hypothetical protein